MFKVKSTSQGDLSIEKDYQFIEGSSQDIITHSCSTAKGDSGTPLIIQPDKSVKECYLIGLHYGKVKNLREVKQTKTK